ncbi:hypothetical protein AK830_g139 [Neonectria ditissima]|uniref:Transcription factor domain-containing protein n=1 Tax=Neonectria ditissima TaxID=78410 RepID=A0A0P7BQF4_9HYPO|nr:hypothetical protein AK830_g139 [Neonectria ditissima]
MIARQGLVPSSIASPNEHQEFRRESNAWGSEAHADDEQIPGIGQDGASTCGQPVDVPTNETVATLEFLTHGRQNILSRQAVSTDLTAGPQLFRCTSPSTPEWDTIVSLQEAHLLLKFHQQTLAWMHNVVHMPTFQQELESNWEQASCDGSWIALYYAILCTTFHHCHEDDITKLGIDITASVISARALYDKSVASLFKANFMAKHTVYSVQTICILMQVAHNIDQSDFISVLISTGIRISQCLNIHRLGADRPGSYYNGQPTATVERILIDREINKRIWWFLVRQDWLQIPFQNTYLIHETQFNTPFPLNCHDEPDLMIRDGTVVSQPDEIYTQNSYTHSISKVAVIIWRQQDRMCRIGHPKSTPGGLQKIYDQVLKADKELNQVYADMPSFFKPGPRQPDPGSGCPPYVSHLASASLLSMAHKVLTIHRHFQLQSFRDRSFAYTQLSCIAIAERCINDFQTWPSDSFRHIARTMWTVSTHLVTCCIILTFASLLGRENELLYDFVKVRRLAELGRDSVRQLEASSSIARRGDILLDILLSLDDPTCEANNARLDLGDIIHRVSRADDNRQEERLPETEQFVLQLGSDAWDGVFGTSDFDVMDIIKSVGMPESTP